MEKMIIFLPMIIFGGFFAVLVIGFLALVVYLIKKGRDSAWTGTVADKIFNEKHEHEIGENVGRNVRYYTLAVKLADGQTRKLAVGKELYDQLQVGDKLVKNKGENWPKKVI